jgi:major membrane immunogen (membrane-anchored lipoprotein)
MRLIFFTNPLFERGKIREGFVMLRKILVILVLVCLALMVGCARTNTFTITHPDGKKTILSHTGEFWEDTEELTDGYYRVKEGNYREKLGDAAIEAAKRDKGVFVVENNYSRYSNGSGYKYTPRNGGFVSGGVYIH